MIGINFPKASPYLLQKMNNLCSLLLQEKNEFEQVATSTKNRDLRSTMLTLAQESKQYAGELWSQIYTMGGVPDIEKNYDFELADNYINLHDNDDEILTFCKRNERKMISAYQETLNESLPYEELRKMIRYQLNEMLCSFMHVKELNNPKYKVSAHANYFF